LTYPAAILFSEGLRIDHHGHDWQDPAFERKGEKSEREIGRLTGFSSAPENKAG